MWFTAYGGAPASTSDRYSPDDRWYYTGDSGMNDEDGYFFFSARDDDMIIMAGYRIGPFEVESAILEHPDVVEVAVVGAPDEPRSEVVEATSCCVPGSNPHRRWPPSCSSRSSYGTRPTPTRARALHRRGAQDPQRKIQRFVLKGQRRS